MIQKRIFIGLTLTSILFLTACSKNQVATTSPAPSQATQDTALKNALNLYAQKKSAGADFSNGPCLGQVASDWVADIAHNPRQKVDGDPKNQCAEYAAGRAHHFIELDPNGKLIRMN